jgi:hypothetical protein
LIDKKRNMVPLGELEKCKFGICDKGDSERNYGADA